MPKCLSHAAGILDRIGLVASSAALLVALAGCTSSGSSSADSANAGLEALAKDPSAHPTVDVPANTRAAEQLSGHPELSLSEIFDSAAPTPRQRAATPTPTPTPSLEPLAQTPRPAPETPGADSKASDPLPQAAVKTPDERIADSAAQLRAALNERRSVRNPKFADIATLAALDALIPSGPAAIDTSLSPAQRSIVSAFGSVISGFTSGVAKDGDPNAAAEVFSSGALAINAVQNVRIARAVLCRRVLGYGQYDPFATQTFLAGRANRALVYVEIDRFAHRAARERDPGADDQGWSSSASDQLWAVEISEELGMWHDADGSLQWRKPEQTVVEVSRNRRRDFYLVQSVDLPETLSVGNYKLKIVIRDKTTGSTDELSVPIQIVADQSVAARPAPSGTLR